MEAATELLLVCVHGVLPGAGDAGWPSLRHGSNAGKLVTLRTGSGECSRHLALLVPTWDATPCMRAQVDALTPGEWVELRRWRVALACPARGAVSFQAYLMPSTASSIVRRGAPAQGAPASGAGAL